MSSMFKKRGGSAFKPKVPTARSRPAARPTQQSRPEPIEAEDVAELASSATPVIDSEPVNSQSAEQTVARDSNRPDTPVENVVSQHTVSGSDLDASQAISHSQDANRTSNVTATATGDSPQSDAPSPKSVTQAKTPTSQPFADSTLPTTVAADDENNEESATSGRSASVLINEEPIIPPPTETEATVEGQTTTAVPAKPARKAARASTSTSAGLDDGSEPVRPKKRQRKAPAREGTEEKPKPRVRKARGTQADQTRSYRGREVTPEDAENQTVDLQKLKMADLTKDLLIGKKFSRHDELRERERQRRLKAKLDKGMPRDEVEATPAPEAELDTQEDAEAATDAQPKSNSNTPAPTAPSPPSQAPAGPQFRIVDGQIVVDQNSLAVDRHARAAAARAGEDMETIEENDFTRLITSNSFMNTSKLRGPNVWTDAETVLFYRGLAMFGTDFEIISKMIPGKQRRHVKLKFNREERHCPRRINAALVGEKTVAMDMEEYKAATGAEFETVESITAEQKKIEDKYEEERQRVADEQAELMRKKREELFADEDGEQGGRKKGRKKKKKVEYGLNGEPVETDS